MFGQGPGMVQVVYARFRWPEAPNPASRTCTTTCCRSPPSAACPGSPSSCGGSRSRSRGAARGERRRRAGPGLGGRGRALAVLVAVFVAGLFEYNLGDSEVLMLVLLADGGAVRLERAASSGLSAMPPLPGPRPRRCFARCAGGACSSLGDVMLDEYLWGRVERISPEAPVPVVEVTRESDHLGGAGNVAAQRARAGRRAPCWSAWSGDDAAARACARRSPRPASTLAPGRATATRPHHGQDAHRRAQPAGGARRPRGRRRRRRAPPSAALVAALRARARRAATRSWSRTTARASSPPPLLRRALARRGAGACRCCVDPKDRHFAPTAASTIVTPNQLEAEQATGVRDPRRADAARRGRAALLALLGADAVLITRGEHGMSLFERGRRAAHLPTAAREVFDVTGAGDTVIARWRSRSRPARRLAEAAAARQHAAGVVVGKVGTAQATPDEVLQAVRLAGEQKRRPGVSMGVLLQGGALASAADRAGSSLSASAQSSRKRS